MIKILSKVWLFQSQRIGCCKQERQFC